MRHPYLADFYSPDDVNPPTRPEPLRLTVSDDTKLTANDYRERLYQEIANRYVLRSLCRCAFLLMLTGLYLLLSSRRDARKQEQARVRRAVAGAPTNAN
jgi:hypothetical protein